MDLEVVAVDGSIHKAPYGGEGTGKGPVDRANLGWKWSISADRAGIPLGWPIASANTKDVTLLDPTLDAIEAHGPHHDVGTLTLDRSLDYPAIRDRLTTRGLTDLDIQRRGTKPPPGTPHRLTLGMRWVVEATNTWWTNYGQLRRNTDRRARHRHAALCLATTVLIVGRLLTHGDRWNPR